jgi:phage baseplate assembly protein W
MSVILPFQFGLGGSPPPPQDPAHQSLFGRDLFFNGVLPLTAKGDYQIVEGDENLRRAVFRILITSPGSYKLRPTYGAGVADFVKKKMTKSALDDLAIRIKDQISQDRRVDKVLEVTFTESENKLSVRIVVQAFGRAIRPLSYDFSKAV